jgi:iron complex transport system substrate-binding protein
MFRKLAFVLTILAFLLAACGPVATPAPTATPAALTFTDGLGREVKLAGPAQRIVSLAPSNTEILFAVGAGKQVVGRDDLSDFPVEAGSLPKIGGMDKYNTEQIVALKPDLVLAAEINSPELVNSLESLGLTVYYLSNPKTIEDMYANLEIVSKLTGHEQETTALVESFKARVAVVDEKIKSAAGKPVVFYELDSTDPAKPWTAGPGSFIDLLINRAGGVNLTSVAGIKDAYPQVSVEQIVSTNPDMIILGDSMWGVTVESVGQRPGWEKLKVVSGKQIFPFDDNLVSRPGPRLVDGLEALAKLLHPELFK